MMLFHVVPLLDRDRDARSDQDHVGDTCGYPVTACGSR